MKLSAEQVQQLFAFTEKKYVRYYDLQVELVDHLATRIEEVMSADEKITFENALKKIYADFGIFGFSKIVQEKELQMWRKGRSMARKELGMLFRWPQIIMTITIGLIVWQLTEWISMDILSPVFIIAWFSYSIYTLVRISRKSVKPKKNLLILQYLPDTGLFPVFMIETMIILKSTAWTPLPFCIIVISGILLKMASFRVYENLKENARKLYPEAFA
jgi:hypothetical protein